MQRKSWIIGGVVAVVVVVTGTVFWLRPRQPQTGGTDRLSLRLQWYPQAQFAGYIIASRLGYYTKQGLDVEIRPGGPDLKPQMTVAAGSDDVGVGVSNQVVSARSNGVPLKIVAQVFQDSANRYVLKHSHAISSLKELRGKKIGLWLGGDEVEFVAMLKTAGMDLKDVDVVPQGFTIIPFLQDQYTLSQVTVYNELIQIGNAGFSGAKLQILAPGDYNSAVVSDMLFTTEGFISSHRDSLRRFLAASLLGWKYCFDEPDKTVEMLLAYNPELKRDEQKQQLKAVLGLMYKGDATTKGLGYMNEAYYTTAERVLYDSGQIHSHVNAAQVFDASPWSAVPDASKKVVNTPHF